MQPSLVAFSDDLSRRESKIQQQNRENETNLVCALHELRCVPLYFARILSNVWGNYLQKKVLCIYHVVLHVGTFSMKHVYLCGVECFFANFFVVFGSVWCRDCVKRAYFCAYV